MAYIKLKMITTHLCTLHLSTRYFRTLHLYMPRLRAQHLRTRFLLTRCLRARHLRKNITNMTFPQPSKIVTLESINGEKSKKCTLWKIPGNILY
uniref:Zinc finger protein n=2 Tax=Loa loa TaxID=7209 RepID=A0A1I7V902_LOALO